MQPSAKVIKDSISPGGSRLTTLEVVMHRFVLAEFNTHRVFSRNSASSRAIPFKKQVDRIKESTAYPVVWASEKPGMQGGGEVEDTELATKVWNLAAGSAIRYAQNLADLGVHKSIINRLLEPFMWHTVVVTSTEWDNFFRQRVSPLAQPEMRAAAIEMQKAYEASTPKPLAMGRWHMPYVDDDWVSWEGGEDPKQVSVARCARVSYLTQDGRRDVQEDVKLYHRLIAPGEGPPHASPLEHVATPAPNGFEAPGNFYGWRQLRHMVLGF